MGIVCSPIDEKTSLNLILTQAALTTWVYGGLLLDKSYFIYRMRFISGLLLVYTLAVLYIHWGHWTNLNQKENQFCQGSMSVQRSGTHCRTVKVKNIITILTIDGMLCNKVKYR